MTEITIEQFKKDYHVIGYTPKSEMKFETYEQSHSIWTHLRITGHGDVISSEIWLNISQPEIVGYFICKPVIAITHDFVTTLKLAWESYFATNIEETEELVNFIAWMYDYYEKYVALKTFGLTQPYNHIGDESSI